jgi:hypothetical protein
MRTDNLAGPGEILTGVMALDYKVPISRLKQYKKIEVFPVNR